MVGWCAVHRCTTGMDQALTTDHKHRLEGTPPGYQVEPVPMMTQQRESPQPVPLPVCRTCCSLFPCLQQRQHHHHVVQPAELTKITLLAEFKLWIPCVTVKKRCCS